ncbi:hypothetical protein [uncultured Phycicoccus sp.]|uniref:hypothetical protein n=1 Tax=uncultured Phycicoccus sp. TaxID=661422 RepID=UPI002609E137|nr:hypothetical protein [uncultured Phycicoccus sp.]
MRRRKDDHETGSAAEIVALYARVKTDAAALDADSATRATYVRDVLALHGTNPLQAMRARLWLQQGRADEGWRG